LGYGLQVAVSQWLALRLSHPLFVICHLSYRLATAKR
jgi:hypothetical protein